MPLVARDGAIGWSKERSSENDGCDGRVASGGGSRPASTTIIVPRGTFPPSHRLRRRRGASMFQNVARAEEGGRRRPAPRSRSPVLRGWARAGQLLTASLGCGRHSRLRPTSTKAATRQARSSRPHLHAFRTTSLAAILGLSSLAPTSYISPAPVGRSSPECPQCRQKRCERPTAVGSRGFSPRRRREAAGRHCAPLYNSLNRQHLSDGQDSCFTRTTDRIGGHSAGSIHGR